MTRTPGEEGGSCVAIGRSGHRVSTDEDLDGLLIYFVWGEGGQRKGGEKESILLLSCFVHPAPQTAQSGFRDEPFWH